LPPPVKGPALEHHVVLYPCAEAQRRPGRPGSMMLYSA